MGKTQKQVRMADVGKIEEGTKAKVVPSRQRRVGNSRLDLDDGMNQEVITPADTANYVNEMAIELKGLAESAKLSFLAYLLDLVIEESAVQKRARL